MTDTAEERDGCSGVSKVVVASGIDVIASERGAPLQSVVYFRIMHCLGTPHYVWDKYLYSVLEKVEVRVTVCVTVCVV